MTVLKQALVVANLCRMGFDAADASRIASTWSERQAQLTSSAIGTFVTSRRVEDVGFPQDVGGRIFMSCHFSAYAVIFRSLAERTAKRRVHCLLASQSPEHGQLLISLARQFDIEIHFIEAGASMLKTIRSVLRDGGTLFVLIDLPWGPSTEPDLSFPFVGGAMRARSALFRMARNLGFEHRFVLVTRNGEDLRVTDHGQLPQEQCFALLRQAVQDDPASYERLYELHKYFVPESLRDVLVCFKVGEDRFAIHGKDMKSWKLPSQMFHPGSVIDKENEHGHADHFERLERLVQRPVAAVVSL